MRRLFYGWLILSFFVSLIGCTPKPTISPTLTLTPVPVDTLDESSVELVTLLGQVTEPRAEISGMAWCRDHLILLPQYPGQYRTDATGFVFSIPRDQISDYLNISSESGIKPDMIPFDQGGLDQSVAGFEGFESIAFFEEHFFVSIESRQGGGMMGYLVKGVVQGDCEALAVDPDSIIEVAPQADLDNMSDETLMIYQDQLFSIYEANGENVNPDPIAHVFDLGLDYIEVRPLPNIEYRITDATDVDEDGKFWAINYFFPGDGKKLKPAIDQIAMEFGLGDSHMGAEGVERIIAMQITDGGIILIDETPIYIELSGESRNWEGIVRFENGFLIVTDKFPTTLLAFVEDIDN
jgi:hypothetical protein